MAAYCSNYCTFSGEKYFQFPQTQTMKTVQQHVESNKLLPQLNTVHRQRISERDRDRERRNKQGASSTPKKKEKSSVRLIHRQSRSCEPRTAAGSSKRPPETKPKTAREKTRKPNIRVKLWARRRRKRRFQRRKSIWDQQQRACTKEERAPLRALLLEKTDRSICTKGNLLSCVPVSRTESEEGKEKKWNDCKAQTAGFYMGTSTDSSVLRADEICEQVFCLFSLSLFFWGIFFFLVGDWGRGEGGGERAMMFYTREQAVDGGFCQVAMYSLECAHLVESAISSPL